MAVFVAAVFGVVVLRHKDRKDTKRVMAEEMALLFRKGNEMLALVHPYILGSDRFQELLPGTALWCQKVTLILPPPSWNQRHRIVGILWSSWRGHEWATYFMIFEVTGEVEMAVRLADSPTWDCSSTIAELDRSVDCQRLMCALPTKTREQKARREATILLLPVGRRKE